MNEDIPHIDAVFSIVSGRHFRGLGDRDELLAECRCSVVELVAKGQYNPLLSALNYTYTRIRNHITNVLSKKCPTSFTDQGIIEGTEDDLLTAPSAPYDPENIMRAVEELVDKFVLAPTLRVFVLRYFADRLGVDRQASACYCSIDFYRQYTIYVRLVEWVVLHKYSSFSVLQNKPLDLLPFLGLQNSQQEALRIIAAMYNEEVVGFILYVLSGQSIRIPARNKVIKTDQGISIYKSLKRRTSSVDALACKYSRSKASVVAVAKRIGRNVEEQ